MSYNLVSNSLTDTNIHYIIIMLLLIIIFMLNKKKTENFKSSGGGLFGLAASLLNLGVKASNGGCTGGKRKNAQGLCSY